MAQPSAYSLHLCVLKYDLKKITFICTRTYYAHISTYNYITCIEIVALLLKNTVFAYKMKNNVLCAILKAMLPVINCCNIML